MYKKELNPYVFILLIFVLAFLPIVSFLFAVKNDILTGYLPVKYFISESISSGTFPWWNSYVNFGLPQHADMSSGFWNPVTWIISYTTGYNIYTITIEVLFYILIGGIGMFKLGELWQWEKNVKLIAAVSYMCCGYFIGHLQHLNWISGAGFLPLCFLNYLLLFKQFSPYRIALSVILFYCFISSAHPGLIIGSIYFFGIITIQEVVLLVKSTKLYTVKYKIGLGITLFLILLCLVLVPMIISYTEIIPYITREIKPTILNNPSNSTTLKSLFSFLLPFPTVKGQDFFRNDISLRNCYVGLLLFLSLICSVQYGLTEKKLRGVFIASFFTLLISIPSVFQLASYHYLPLLGYVRLPGEYRIFSLFGLIVIASTWLNLYLNQKIKIYSFNRIVILFYILLVIVILWSFLKINSTNDSIFLKTLPSTSFKNPVIYIKSIIDAISLYDAAIIHSLVQILLLTFLQNYFNKRRPTSLLVICALDLLIATSLNLPFTGYGKSSPAVLQSILNNAPKGIITPALQAIKLNNEGISGIDTILGPWSFYNKQPGTVKQVNYPIQFKTESNIFSKPNMNYISVKPFIFFITDTTVNKIKEHLDSTNQIHNASLIKLIINRFNANQIKATLTSSEKGFIVLLYKDYKHWKCILNNHVVPKTRFLNSFICIPIKKHGTNEVEFNYEPKIIQFSAVISFIILLLLLAYLIFTKTKRSFKK